MKNHVIGWRTWRVRLEKPHYLTSVRWRDCWPATWLTATCHRPPASHARVPDASCECGIYIRDTPSSPLITDDYDGGFYAAGRVVGWGQIVPTGEGWRVQYARPLEITEVGDLVSIEQIQALRDMYRIPVRANGEEGT